MTVLPEATQPPSPRRNALLAPSPHPRRTLLLGAATALVVIVLGFLLRAGQWDVALSARIHAHDTGVVGAVATAVYHALTPVPAAIATFLVAAVIAVAGRRWTLAVSFVGVVAITWVLAELAKVVVDRPRPGLTALAQHAPHVTVPPDASFPSGHVAFTASLVVAIILMLRGSAWFRPALVVGIVAVAAMVGAVVVVGVHFVGDALASVVWVCGVLPAVRVLWAVMAVPRAEAFLARRRGLRGTALRRGAR